MWFAFPYIALPYKGRHLGAAGSPSAVGSSLRPLITVSEAWEKVHSFKSSSSSFNIFNSL